MGLSNVAVDCSLSLFSYAPILSSSHVAAPGTAPPPEALLNPLPTKAACFWNQAASSFASFAAAFAFALPLNFFAAAAASIHLRKDFTGLGLSRVGFEKHWAEEPPGKNFSFIFDLYQTGTEP